MPVFNGAGSGETEVELMKSNHFRTFLASFRTRRTKAGTYTLLASALVIAIAVLINLAIGKLPASITQKDISSHKMFTLSEQSIALTEGLLEPVTLYWIVTDGNEDGYLSQLLPMYEERSANLTVQKIDPVVQPGFAGAYTDQTPSLNDLIAVSETRSCYIPYSSLYLYNYANYYATGSYDTRFAGESEITRAIDFVTTDNLSKVYLLTGHGESALPASFSSGMRTLNLETEALNLLTVPAVPEDADCLLLCNPQSDLSETERDMMLSYLDAGGNLFLLTDCETDGQWPNLSAVTQRFGLRAHTGIVIEGDDGMSLANYPYYLLPSVSGHAITAPIADAGYAVILPFSGAMATENVPESVTVEALLESSDKAYLKASGSGADSIQREAGDLDGPFLLAAAASDSSTSAHLVWCASTMLLDEEVNVISSGADEDFFLNALAWMCGHESAINIHPKQMDSQLLVVPAKSAAILTVIICFVIPIVILAAGVTVTVKRRRR